MCENNKPTDLKNLITMLLNSNETFSKENSRNDWIVRITSRKINFYFNNDESFKFCCYE
jgi:hypothetical protein